MSRLRLVLWAAIVLVASAMAACTAIPALPAALPTATPTPSVPDARFDPLAAVMYSADPGRFRSAAFTYRMNLGVRPADDASAQALGPSLEDLDSAAGQIWGEGELEMIDPQTGKANLRMKLNLEMADQTLEIETIIVDGVSWVRTAPDQPWEKADMPTATATGIDPSSALAMIKDASKVEWVDEIELNGERVQHLRYTIDPAKANFAELLKPAGSEAVTEEQLDAMFNAMTVEAELWLRASDLQIRQQRVLMTMPLTVPEEVGLEDVSLLMDVDMLMTYDRVNEPVVIEVPKE